RRRCEVVLAFRPRFCAETSSWFVAAPGTEVHALSLPDALPISYSKRHSVTWPALGLTLAASVAVVWVTEAAVPVSTVGGLGSVADGRRTRLNFSHAHVADAGLCLVVLAFRPLICAETSTGLVPD